MKVKIQLRPKKPYTCVLCNVSNSRAYGSESYGCKGMIVLEAMEQSFHGASGSAGSKII